MNVVLFTWPCCGQRHLSKKMVAWLQAGVGQSGVILAAFSQGQRIKSHVSSLSSTQASLPGCWVVCPPAFPGLSPPISSLLLLPPHRLLSEPPGAQPFFCALYPSDYKAAFYCMTSYTIYYTSVMCLALGCSCTSLINSSLKHHRCEASRG